MALLGIRHAALLVSDIPRALRFYREALGFEPVYAGDADWAMIAQGGTTLSLIRAERVPPAVSAALAHGSHPAHLGVVTDSRAEVDAALARVRAVHPELPLPAQEHRDGSYGFYLRDPDGNALEVIFIPHQLVYPNEAPRLGDAGIVLFGHGSGDARWREPVERLLARLREHAPGAECRAAYLEFCEPSLEQAVNELVAAGRRRIFVAPVFISSGGGHMRRDFPEEIEALRRRHPTLRIQPLPVLGESAESLEAFAFTAIREIQRLSG